MEFGSVDTILQSVQNRLNDLHTGYALYSGNTSIFTPNRPSAQLAAADSVLPFLGGPKSDNQWGAYAGGFGQFMQVNGDGNAPGYSVQNSGATVDFDKQFDRGLVGGVTLDYINGEAGLDNGGSASMQGGRGGVYGAWYGRNAYLEGQLGGGVSSYDTKRSALGGTANGSTDGYEMDGMLGGGYDFKYKSLIAGLLAETHYTYADVNGFTESGSASPMQIMDNNNESLWTLVGCRLAYEWQIHKQTIRPEFRLGWRHEFLDTQRQIQSSFASGAGSVFQVDGPSLGSDSLSVGAGLSTRCTEHLSLFLSYDGELGRNQTTSHAVNGGMSWDF